MSMIGLLDTGSVCLFPKVFPPGINFSSTDASQCTMTYAQRLGTDHDILQGVLMAISFGSFLEIARRMYSLKRYTARKNIKFSEFPTFPYFLACLVFCFFFALESVDVFAFRGWYPPHLYYILDEFIASSLIFIAIVLVDFWVRCAKGIGRNAHGLDVRERNVLIAAVFCNFVGWITVGVIHSANFKLYEAIKSFGGAGLLIFFQVRSGAAVHNLRKTLLGSSQNSSSPNVLASTTSGNDASNRDVTGAKKRNWKAITVLTRKYLQFSVLIIVAAFALIVNGFLSLSFESNFDWQWRVRFEEIYDPIQIVLKVIYLVAALAQLSFFHVPKDLDSIQGSSTNSSHNINSGVREAKTSVLGIFGSSVQGWMSNQSSFTNGKTSPLSHGPSNSILSIRNMREDSAPDHTTALVADIGVGLYTSTVERDEGKPFQMSNPTSVVAPADATTFE